MAELHPHNDERIFRADVTALLKSLLQQLDDIDSDDLDPRLSEGNLAVTFESGGTILLSQQTPTRELWLSANLRAWHFKAQDGVWVERDTGAALLEVLSRLFTEKLNLNIHFR